MPSKPAPVVHKKINKKGKPKTFLVFCLHETGKAHDLKMRHTSNGSVMPIYVTAIYKIYETGYDAAVWQRLSDLACIFPEIHLVCSAQDRAKAETITNLIPHYHEFSELETHKLLNQASHLPPIRKPSKDTKEFMILMNAKTEFIHIVRNKGFFADHYVWLDAGISKIFRNPIATLTALRTTLTKPLKNTHIFIPGCHGPQKDARYLTHCINWRFCGGFFVVPNDLVVPFYSQVLHGCEELMKQTNKATWEVNVWAYIESRLPIHWEHGDHNEHMFSGVVKLLV
jgi:hypothetical protein